VGLSVFDEFSPIFEFGAVDNTSGVGAATAVGARPFGYRTDAFVVSNSDVIDHICSIGYVGDLGYQQFGSVVVAAGAGTDGSRGVDLVASALPSSMTGFLIGQGNALIWDWGVAVVSGKVAFALFGGRVS